MNILVIGANGQLGNEIRRNAPMLSHRFIFTDINEIPGLETVYLDATDIDAVRLIAESESIDMIINCSAYTNVDKAETDYYFADLLNHKLPQDLATVAKERDAVLISISTDYVFSGMGCLPIRETQEPDPRSVYGSTKLAGEKVVQSSGCRYIIIRTSWLYSPYGKNFVKTMRHLTKVNDSVKVVYDQVGSPTYAADLAKAILHIIETEQYDKQGLYHYSNEGAVSWFDFAHEICELSGNDCNVRPCLSSEFPSKVDRPHYSVFDKSLIKDTFGIAIPHWRDSLKDCINRLEEDES